jgi:ABC-type multidrug transport system ATPase subunit
LTSIAVTARALEKRFGPVAALRGVDLEIAAGTALAILGPNGAGKSTLLRIAAGLSLPTAGSLEIRVGESGDAKQTRAHARAKVGFVGHATLLSPELTARENLLFAARLYAVPDAGARADQLLAEEGLSEFAGRRAGTFSRGMAQRLSIARALVHDPQLILLDEPFTGLDPASSERLAQRIVGLRQEGRTLMVTTHDLARACAFADEAIVIARGKNAHRASGDALELAALEASYARAVGAAPS